MSATRSTSPVRSTRMDSARDTTMAVRFGHPLYVVLLCVLLVPLFCLSGCGTKKPAGKPHISGTAKRKPGTKTPATQRPYVIKGITYYPIPSAKGYREQGLASWYGDPFHGRRTSNGEVYDMYADTAAHKTLPMHTMLLVRNLENGRSTVVRINDRGPFVRERIIDLSFSKARELGVVARGTARVEIVALEEMEEAPAPSIAATRPGQSRPEQTQTGGKAPAPQLRPKQPIPDFDRGNFFVQVGAFERIDDARAKAREFAKLGRDVVIQQYPAAGMNLYRVLVFASHSLREAKQYEAQMRQAGYRYTLLLAR